MRCATWPQVLAAKIEEWRHRPMHYGAVDCCQFCGEVVLAIADVDHRATFPAYASRDAAEAILASMGGMQALLTSVLGEPKAAAFAQRGDVILADFGDGLAPGICIGEKSCTPGPRGLVFIPTLAGAICAWSVE